MISLKGDENEWRAVVDTCGKYEYDGSLYVDTQVFGVASPKEEAMAAGCPLVMFHVVFDEEDELATTPVRKGILIWEDKDEGEALITEGSLPMGTFMFSDIARAYEAANLKNADDGAYVYDIISNNGAEFAIEMGSMLGVKIDREVTSFVARSLLENSDDSKALVNSIRSNIGYLSIFKDDRNLRAKQSLTDEELVELLVETRTSKLY